MSDTNRFDNSQSQTQTDFNYFTIHHMPNLVVGAASIIKTVIETELAFCRNSVFTK